MRFSIDLQPFFASPHFPLAVKAVRVALFVLAALFVLRALGLARRMRVADTRVKFPGLRVAYAGLCLVFLAVFAYQGSWQLAGFTRPDFLSFIQRYNRRSDSSRAARGDIVDRNGITLATTDRSAAGARVYPQRGDCAHLVGYDHSHYGRAGVEAAENLVLSGAVLDPIRDFERLGRGMLDHGQVRGRDVRLTIDARMQHTAMLMLHGRRGAVVGIRPTDGEVLVLASSPTFDPNRFDPRSLERADSPFFNRALHGQYPPGSTFKILVALAALETGLDQPIECPPEGFIPGPGSKPIRDHEYYEAERRNRRWRGHGRIGLQEAFERSSNVYFGQVAIRLGANRLSDLASRLRLGERLVLLDGTADTISAVPSRVPDLTDSEPANLALFGIGQGALTVTPLHIAFMTAAIANDGMAWRPTCRPGQTELLGRVCDAGHARELQRLMRGVVQRGTGAGARIAGLQVSGKTGTAQTGSGADHSWFTCFAPAERPMLALAVIVEHGGYGSAAAVPIARELLVQAAELGLLDPASASASAAGGAP